MTQKIETVVCECGVTFANALPDPVMGFDFAAMFFRKLCDSCQGKAEAEAEAEAKEAGDRFAESWVAEFRALVAENVFPVFRATRIDHPKFNRPAWECIRRWRPSDVKPWLGLRGGTGGSKSRIAYLWASEALERMARAVAPRSEYERDRRPRRVTYRFTTAYKIAETVMAQYGDGDSAKWKAREWLDRLRNVDLLLVDDLGKGKLSPAVSSEMYALIDHRHVNQLLTIWTSNSRPEEIASCMSDDMGGPFAGRLNESSKIFTFK